MENNVPSETPTTREKPTEFPSVGSCGTGDGREATQGGNTRPATMQGKGGQANNRNGQARAGQAANMQRLGEDRSGHAREDTQGSRMKTTPVAAEFKLFHTPRKGFLKCISGGS